MRCRNWKSRKRGENDRETGAYRHGENEIFGAGKMIWDDPFPAEFGEQSLREKDRHNGPGECGDRCPRDRRAIIAGAAAKERCYTLEVVVRAVGVSEKAGSKKQRDEDHAASVVQCAAHQCAIFCRIASRTSRVCARRSSRVPVKMAGSGKLQCSRLVLPVKLGHLAA